MRTRLIGGLFLLALWLMPSFERAMADCTSISEPGSPSLCTLTTTDTSVVDLTDSDPVYWIPVTWVVLYKNGTSYGVNEHLSSATLGAMITRLNEHYAAVNSSAPDSRMRFFTNQEVWHESTAQHDSLGNLLLPIKAKNAIKTYLHNTYGLDATTDYIIYTTTYSDIIATDGGDSTWPFTDAGTTRDGSVMDWRAVKFGAAPQDFAWQQGGAVTHEAGHIFGLVHTHQNISDCTTDPDCGDPYTTNDAVADTPCSTEQRECGATDCNDEDNANFMAKVPDGCLDKLFTAGQAARMRCVVDAYRPDMATWEEGSIVDVCGNTYEGPVTVTVAGFPPYVTDSGTVWMPCGYTGNVSVSSDDVAFVASSINYTGSPLEFVAYACHGTISSDTTWATDLLLDGDVLVAQGVTLTIDAGVDVSFALTDKADLEPFFEDRVELHVKGHLEVDGSVSQLVRFTSASASPAPDDWVHIQVLGGSINIEHAVVEYSEWGIGTSTTDTISVYTTTFSDNGAACFRVFNDPSAATVSGCVFDVGSAGGVTIQGPNCVVADNVFTGTSSSDFAIKVASGAEHVTIDGNDISDFSSTYGIWLTVDSSTVTDNEIADCDRGIYVTGGRHRIGTSGAGNDISGCTTGLYVQCGGPGTCPGSCSVNVVARYNSIYSNYDGVVTVKTAAVNLGSTSHASWGNNNIAFNTNHCVSNTSSCGTVSAVGNYFGSCTTPTCTNGSVDTSNWLCSPAGLVYERPQPDEATPSVTRLLGAVPNPFNPTTSIHYELASPGRVEIRVYDVQGRLVVATDRGHQPTGAFAWDWNGRNRTGAVVASGVYYVVMNVDDRPIGTRKVVMLK